MDFISFMRDQSGKLNSRHHFNYLWNELEENRQEETNENSKSDFNNHLPILYETFWAMAVEKVQATDVILSEVDDELRKYILVLIYHTIAQSSENEEKAIHNCTLNACCVYLELITLADSEAFFHSNLYRSALLEIKAALELFRSEHLTQMLVRKARKFLISSKLTTSDLEVSLALFVQIIFMKSNSVYKNFNEIEDESRNKETSPCFEALLALKQILELETVPNRKFIITTFLFNGLRPYGDIISPNYLLIIQTNFRSLLKSLHNKFDEDDYKTFMNAFIHVWKHEDFIYYSEAVSILNSLDKKYYHILTDYLNKILVSNDCQANFLNLAVVIFFNPPSYFPEQKVIVANEILLKNIILNSISEKKDVCEAALECFATVLLSPDVKTRNIVKNPITLIFNDSTRGDFLSVSAILAGLESLITPKWSNANRQKNRNLFAIVISIISVSETDHPGVYCEILDVLTAEASPFDLKAYLQLLGETYIELCRRKFEISAFQLLKILFKCALNSLATSSDFVKYLYNAMVQHSDLDVNKFFIEPIISENFNYVELFQKCACLGLIRDETIESMIDNVGSMREANLKLICALIERSNYNKLHVIVDYIERNACSSEVLNYLFYIYGKIWKKGSFRSDREVINSNKKMVNFLRGHLRNQTLGTNCVSNAFSLMKALKSYTNLEEDFRDIQEEYDRKALDCLLQAENSQYEGEIRLLHYSQLVIFSGLVPKSEVLDALVHYLDQSTSEEYRSSSAFSTDFWTAALFLFTNVCVIRPNLVESGVHFLLQAQNCPFTRVKLAAIDMTFDLCNLITHNFEDLISYMFRQLVLGDQVYKRSCLKKIDRLIRDEYLKLDLTHFIIFVSMLCNRNGGIEEYFASLLEESFFVQQKALIGRFMVPLLVHLNGYRVHPMYQIEQQNYDLIGEAVKNLTSRRQIYALLLSNIERKARFNIIGVISTTILDKVTGNSIKEDGGFWKMIKDCIFVFNLVDNSIKINESNSSDIKKVMSDVKKQIIHKPNITNYKPDLMESHKDIVQSTETILKVFFFCNERKLRYFIFEAIINWTNYLLHELVYLIHVDRLSKLQQQYAKFERFYLQNENNLILEEVGNIQVCAVMPPVNPVVLHNNSLFRT